MGRCEDDTQEIESRECRVEGRWHVERWEKAFAGDTPVRWYQDKVTGKTMNRPGWQQLESDFNTWKIAKIVVWRLDRLGCPASGLTTLFDELRDRKVNLVSLKDGLDLSKSAGRLIAGVLASVARFGTEIRSERVQAGQATAKADGKTWGGSRKGRRIKIGLKTEATITQLREQEMPVAQTARAVELTCCVLGNFRQLSRALRLQACGNIVKVRASCPQGYLRGYLDTSFRPDAG